MQKQDYQSYWNNFVSLIRGDIRELKQEQRKISLEIKKIERLKSVLEYSKNDVEMLLLHKTSITEVDPTLTQKFQILEAFQKRNNLDNAVAIKTIKDILENKTINEKLRELNTLLDKKLTLEEETDKIIELVKGISYDLELIDILCKKHNLDPQVHTSLLIYPTIKSAQRKVANIRKKEEISQKQNDNNKEDSIKQEVKEDITIIHSYEEEFLKQKNRYEEIKENGNELINKYYNILTEMTNEENQCYRAYCYIKEEMQEDEIKTQFKEKHETALAKITAIKLFDDKAEIEKLLKEIEINNYSNKDDIDFLEEYINEYELALKKLKELDEKIIDQAKEKELLEKSKVFFLTDENDDILIPENIRDGKSLINIIKKGDGGYIQKKQNSNIMPLKIKNKSFEKNCGRSILAVRNYKIIVSYIKLNSSTGKSNDGGILILTASLLNDNKIEENTQHIIDKYEDKIIKQIEELEMENPQQIELQDRIRTEIIKEGESHGRKTK